MRMNLLAVAAVALVLGVLVVPGAEEASAVDVLNRGNGGGCAVNADGFQGTGFATLVKRDDGTVASASCQGELFSSPPSTFQTSGVVSFTDPAATTRTCRVTLTSSGRFSASCS